MLDGSIDLDYDDDQLREEMSIITYKFNTRGAIQITPKDEMKTEIGGSPDRLDAIIMAAADMSPWTGNPLNALEAGTKVLASAEEFYPDLMWYEGKPGTPI